jgi:hypothetical protein
VAVVLGLNGLYPAQDVVRAVLSPEPGETKNILDLGVYENFDSMLMLNLGIGCGTGVW